MTTLKIDINRRNRRYALDRYGNILRDSKTHRPLFEDEVDPRPATTTSYASPDKQEKIRDLISDPEWKKFENKILSAPNSHSTSRKRDEHREMLYLAGLEAWPSRTKPAKSVKHKNDIDIHKGDSILMLMEKYGHLKNLVSKLCKVATERGLILNFATGRVE